MVQPVRELQSSMIASAQNDMYVRVLGLELRSNFARSRSYLLHKRVSVVETIQSIQHPIRLESPRWRVEVQVHRLVTCQFGLSLYDVSLHL